MDSLAFLNFWKSGADPTTPPGITSSGANPVSRTPTTEDSESDDAEGDFIDLQFAGDYGPLSGNQHVPCCTPGQLMEVVQELDHEDDGYDVPEDDVSVDGAVHSISNQQHNQPFAVSTQLMKSATKLRVLMMSGLKKPKTKPKTKPIPIPIPASTTTKKQDAAAASGQKDNNNNKPYFKVEELVSIVSLFTTRDAQSGSPSNSKKYHSDKLSRFSVRKPVPKSVPSSTTSCSGSPESKPNEQQPSYRKEEVDQEPGKEDHGGFFVGKLLQQQGNNLAAMGLRVLVTRRRYLGKRRSASSSSSSSSPVTGPSPMVRSQKRDDSLLQQQDGIESAILHCKKSFNGGRPSSGEGGETGTSSSMLVSPSVSDPSYEKSMKGAAAAAAVAGDDRAGVVGGVEDDCD